MQSDPQQLLKAKPLKEVFADPDLRKKFAEQKLQGKGHNQVLVRCEPHPRHSNIEEAPFFLLIAPAWYEVAYLSATVHTRVGSRGPGPAAHSTYIFCNGALVTGFRDKIGPFWQKNREEDGILYLYYADSAPF